MIHGAPTSAGGLTPGGKLRATTAPSNSKRYTSSCHVLHAQTTRSTASPHSLGGGVSAHSKIAPVARLAHTSFGGPAYANCRTLCHTPN
jgi:hypothetical protein